MKLIAHRGGSLGKENSFETFLASARMGADMVECDIRRTKDGVLVIYHDPSLERLAGYPVTVDQVTLEEMQEMHAAKGLEVLTFHRLAAEYKEQTPILLHIKLLDYDEAFAKHVVDSGLPIIPGVMSLDMLRCFTSYLPPERILAFIPQPEMAKDFYDNGVGIIRLWEQWLEDITPADVKAMCPKAQVFIMACNLKRGEDQHIPLETMDGSRESLEKCLALGADGVLLNRIEMALEWRKNL